MSLKSKIINKIIKIEGGYVNDPSDSGGETNFGITIKVARKFGYKDDMKKIPRKVAFEIYEKLYWDALSLDTVERIASKEVTEELADTSVNMGTKRACEFLQRCLNVLNNRQAYWPDLKVDKHIGTKTIACLEAHKDKRGKKGMVVLYKMLNCLQGAFYIKLAECREKDEKFILGWFSHRVF